VSERRIRAIEIDKVIVHGERTNPHAVATAVERALGAATPVRGRGVAAAAQAAGEAVAAAVARRKP
jgi:hypothetical protein